MKNSLAHPCNPPLRTAPPQSVGQASPASIVNRPYLSAASKYIPQIFAESRQIGLIGGVVLQVAYAARLP